MKPSRNFPSLGMLGHLSMFGATSPSWGSAFSMVWYFSDEPMFFLKASGICPESSAKGPLVICRVMCHIIYS